MLRRPPARLASAAAPTVSKKRETAGCPPAPAPLANRIPHPTNQVNLSGPGTASYGVKNQSQRATEHAAITPPSPPLVSPLPTQSAVTPMAPKAPTSIANMVPHTPIKVARLRQMLSDHPNQLMINDVCNSLTDGVNIGYNGPRAAVVTKNMQSSVANPEVVQQTVRKEVESGWSEGPFASTPFPNFVVNSIGVIPKKSGGFRMITDLSRPEGGVNNAICKEDFTLQYASVDDAVAILQRLGTSAVMCKLDIKDAFRLIPVRKADWPLLGYEWNNHFYFHTKLPFGLRSSPYHFNRFAVLLAWLAGSKSGSTDIVQYLDDFWCGGEQHMCEHMFKVFKEVCTVLCVPLAVEKLEGPTSIITFLGIQIDSTNQTLALPQDKLQEITKELSQWGTLKKCTKRQLLSLIGKLSFAAKCVPAGRLFFRRLIDLSMKARRLSHRLDLTKEARADIAWWAEFLPKWNGTALFIQQAWSSADSLELYTDAAASIGAGGYFKGRWFYIPWTEEVKMDTELHITWMELFPIVVAAKLWGSEWAQRKIRFHTDNQAAVDIWYKQSSRSPPVMSLVRKLFLVAAQGNFHVSLAHIPGRDNVLADCISRNLQEKFHRQAPQADRNPTAIPEDMLRDLYPEGP